jgi:hydrogenase nickel incorporation protein HypA/HybF
MHELSIASTILDRALAASADNGHARIIKIGLRIGEIAGVEPDALSFGFEALCRSTAAQGAVLEIEYCRRKQLCSGYGKEFEPDGSVTACPWCSCEDSVCVAGAELDVTFIELEDAACA